MLVKMNLMVFNMKKCSKCNIEKQLLEFNKGRNHCKECRKIYRKFYTEKNHEILKIYYKKRYIENRESELERTKQYRINNIDILKKKDKDRYRLNPEKEKERTKKYRLENPKKVLETQKKSTTKRYQKDILFKLKHNVRCRIYQFLKIKNITKKNSTFNVVGCQPQQLKEYLESLFTNDMSWDNYGKWHIDHIIPLSSAKNEEEVYNLCRYTNLQPLWAEDNLKKNNKIL
jgi:hypothetical protein